MKHWTVSAAALALACAPELDDRSYLVETARLIAVIAEPPEARPGEVVTLSAVVAGRQRGEVAFRFCTAQRRLADPRPIADACLEDAGIPLEPRGAAARGVMPSDACARFGPDPARAQLRPADPDATGGFYQPLIVEASGTDSVAFIRIKCPLPDAPADLARALDARYELNENPVLSALEPEQAADLHAGEPVSLRVSWPENTRESYVWLPPDAEAVEPRHEGLRVAWFVSGGTLASSTTGRSETDSTPFSSNTFTPPASADSVEVWAVLQDSRRGTGALHTRLIISP